MMGLIESLETAIRGSRQSYAELLKVTTDLLSEREQQGYRIPLRAQPWTEAQLRKGFPSFRAAQAYFYQRYGVKAKGWRNLLERVNAVETALIHLGLAIRENPKARAIAIRKG
ncbi:hypothetical protein RYO59_001380 [Thermosynechococcaceae cyanobacterium Okahandja]